MECNCDYGRDSVGDQCLDRLYGWATVGFHPRPAGCSCPYLRAGDPWLVARKAIGKERAASTKTAERWRSWNIRSHGLKKRRPNLFTTGGALPVAPPFIPHIKRVISDGFASPSYVRGFTIYLKYANIYQ